MENEILKNINEIESEMKTREEARLKELGYLENYGGSLTVKYIKEGVFSVEGNSQNITYYIDNESNIILSVKNLYNLSNFNIYSDLIGLTYDKSENGVYTFYKQDNGEKRELDKYSVEYFEVWRDIAFTLSRDTILKTIEGTGRSVTHKIPDKALDIFIQEDKAIRLVELMLLGQKGNITKEQFHNHFRELQTQLLSQIGDSRFGLLPNNRQYNINREEKTYTIQTGKVTLDEVNYLKDVGIISDDVYELAINKLKDLEEIREETKGELSEIER